MRQTTLIAFLALASLSTSCTSNRAFSRVDADGRGGISSDEFVTHVQRNAFDDIDTNGNAFLDSDEWKTAETTNQPTKRFALLDRNGDRRLSFKEFANSVRKKQTLKRIFRTVDRDDSGHLSPEELNSNTGDAP